MANVVITQGVNQKGERITVGVDGETEDPVFFVEGTGDDERGAFVAEKDVIPGYSLWHGMSASPEARQQLHDRMAEYGMMPVGGDGAETPGGSTFGLSSAARSRYGDIFGHEEPII